MTKQGIKEILQQWYILTNTLDVSIVEYIVPIELGLKELVEEGWLTEEDTDILDAYLRGFNYSEISRLFQISRQTASSRIDRVAVLLLMELGDSYGG